MLTALEKNRFAEVINSDDSWYEDAPSADPNSGASPTEGTGAEPAYVLEQGWECSDFFSEAPHNDRFGNRHVVDSNELRDQFLQKDAHDADVAHPPMLKLTKLAGPRCDDVFDQVWDCNQDVPNSVLFDGEPGGASSDYESDDAKQHKKRGRPCKGKRQRFRKYVEKMKLEIDKDPFGFNVDNVGLPVSITTANKLQDKFIQILRNYQIEVLEGLADPSK